MRDKRVFLVSALALLISGPLAVRMALAQESRDDTEGLFAGVSIAVSNISRDEDRNRAYYQRQVTTPQLLSGSVTNPDARALQEALPDRVATLE